MRNGITPLGGDFRTVPGCDHRRSLPLWDGSNVVGPQPPLWIIGKTSPACRAGFPGAGRGDNAVTMKVAKRTP